MKQSILGGLIGLSIVLSLDSVTRVFMGLYFDQQILMFSYGDYPGFFSPVVLVLMAAVSTFLGALFAFSYGKEHQVVALLTYLLLILLIRYGQTHLLYSTEGIFYPIIALILSLIVIFIAWKIIRPSKQKENDEQFRQGHHPVEPGA